MSRYIDGFVIAIPKKKITAYKRISTRAGKIWKEHGALEYIECLGDDLTHKDIVLRFPRMVRCKPGGTVAFSWVVYRNKAHRDRVNKNIMADPHMLRMMKEQEKDPPFDMKRMAYGGFKTLVRM